MTTPAKRHKLRVLAELAAKAAGPGDEVRGSAYELMLAQLAEHKRTLKTIQSMLCPLEKPPRTFCIDALLRTCCVN